MRIVYTKSRPVERRLAIEKVPKELVPSKIKSNKEFEAFPRYYRVRNGEDGMVFFYLALGNPAAPREVCGFYNCGSFWTSYGNTLAEAVNGMIKDGWLYTQQRNWDENRDEGVIGGEE
jgi:hypothetical protein